MRHLPVVLFLLAALTSIGCAAPPPGPCPSTEPQNPAQCPATWADSYSLRNPPGKACTTPGLSCWYPGAGDCGECCATALLACLEQDGGQGVWTYGQ